MWYVLYVPVSSEIHPPTFPVLLGISQGAPPFPQAPLPTSFYLGSANGSRWLKIESGKKEEARVFLSLSQNQGHLRQWVCLFHGSES